MGQNESLPSIKGKFDNVYGETSNGSGAFSVENINSWSRGYGSPSNNKLESILVFNSSKTLNEYGNTISNTTYKDGAEVKTKNFTYKNWFRKF